ALAARIRPAAWTAVARAALTVAAIPGSTFAALVAWMEGAPAGPPSPSPDAGAAPVRAADRIVRRSSIVHAISAHSADPQTRAALAILGALEAEPAALRRDAADALSVIALVQREMDDAPVDADTRAGHRSSARDADGNGRGTDPRTTDRAVDGRTAASPSTGTDGRRAAEKAEGDKVDKIAPSPSAGDGDAPWAVRAAGETRWGGLLFLIHLIDSLDLPDAMAEDEALAARSLRWCLHRLAMELLGLNERDPAVLAFAGLGPDRDLPSRGEEAAAEDEVQAVADFARRVASALHVRMRGAQADGRRAEDALLREVCRRAATVAADPGWIEVRLSLDEVSVEVRRAGLDLDPGWVPWLGAAVRFVYG
ncbi:MAG TPA: hypothetical protein VF665_23190, partial [Longimicrobium sp.]